MRSLFTSALLVLGGAVLGAGGFAALKELAPPPARTALVEAPPPEPTPPRPEIVEPPPPSLPEPAPQAPPSLPAPAERATPEPPPAPPRPAMEFFGFPVETLQRAPDPPPPPPQLVVAEPPKPPPPEAARYVPIPEKCVAGFDGTSTLHDFRGWTRAVTGEIRFEKDRLEATAKATLAVDARTLDTGNPDRDKDMHELLQSEKFPEFRFTLTEFKPEGGGAFAMKGALEIRGQTRPVEIPGTFGLRADGLLHVKGEFKAKMSDFGIQPPSAMLVIRTSDDIKIWFELWARRAGGAP